MVHQQPLCNRSTIILDYINNNKGVGTVSKVMRMINEWFSICTGYARLSLENRHKRHLKLAIASCACEIQWLLAGIFFVLVGTKTGSMQNMRIPLKMGRCLHIFMPGILGDIVAPKFPHSPSDLMPFSCNNTVGLNPCATYTSVNSIIRLTVRHFSIYQSCHDITCRK